MPKTEWMALSKERQEELIVERTAENEEAARAKQQRSNEAAARAKQSSE
jgi:hypothetical protein